MDEYIRQLIAIAKEYQQLYQFKVVLMSATVDAGRLLSEFPASVQFEMAPQERAEEFAVSDQPMRSLGNEVVRDVQVEQFTEAGVSKPVVRSVLQNMAIQICRVMQGATEPNLQGDVLAFVPGIADFDALTESIMGICKRQKISTAGFEFKYIHSRFSEELKQEVIEQREQRAIIISTTICETSLTIPSLSYVIDCCLNKKMVDG